MIVVTLRDKRMILFIKKKYIAASAHVVSIIAVVKKSLAPSPAESDATPQKLRKLYSFCGLKKRLIQFIGTFQHLFVFTQLNNLSTSDHTREHLLHCCPHKRTTPALLFTQENNSCTAVHTREQLLHCRSA